MKFLTAFRYALVHIFHDSMRTILTVISLATIVCVYLLSRGLVKDLDGISESRFNFPESVLLVMSSNSVFPGDSMITMQDLDFYLDQINTRFGAGHVSEVIPMIYHQVYLDGEAVMVAGVSYETLERISRVQLLEGAWPASFSEVIINKEYSRVSGKQVGDQFPVYGREMTVSGICESSMWRNSAIVLSFDQAVDVYGYSGQFQIGAFSLKEDLSAILVHDSLKSIQKDETCCNIYLHDHYNQQVQTALRGFKTLSSIIQVIVLLLLTFCTYNAAALVLAEHQREIILLRVNGFSVKQVNLVLFLRTTIVVLLAFLIGLLVSVLIINIKRMGDAYTLAGVQILLQFEIRDVVIGLVLSTFLTAFSAFVSLFRHDPLQRSQDLKALFMGRVG